MAVEEGKCRMERARRNRKLPTVKAGRGEKQAGLIYDGSGPPPPPSHCECVFCTIASFFCTQNISLSTCTHEFSSFIFFLFTYFTSFSPLLHTGD